MITLESVNIIIKIVLYIKENKCKTSKSECTTKLSKRQLLVTP